MAIKWQIEKRNIDDLKGYEKNPRKFTDKGLKDLKKSLENCRVIAKSEFFCCKE